VAEIGRCVDVIVCVNATKIDLRSKKLIVATGCDGSQNLSRSRRLRPRGAIVGRHVNTSSIIYKSSQVLQ